MIELFIHFLREKVQNLINNPQFCTQMGEAARKEYLQKYTPEKNYKMLMEIYEKALNAKFEGV